MLKNVTLLTKINNVFYTGKSSNMYVYTVTTHKSLIYSRCLASLSSTHSDESRDSLTHTPSLDAALATVPRQVPSLLLMAASALNLGGGKKTAELNGFEMKDNMEDRPK